MEVDPAAQGLLLTMSHIHCQYVAGAEAEKSQCLQIPHVMNDEIIKCLIKDFQFPHIFFLLQDPQSCSTTVPNSKSPQHPALTTFSKESTLPARRCTREVVPHEPHHYGTMAHVVYPVSSYKVSKNHWNKYVTYALYITTFL